MKSKILIVIIFILGFFGWADSSWAGTLLLSEDFESGSFLTNDWAALNTTISAEQSHGGTYSARCNHAGVVVLSKTLDIELMKANPEITLRFWWYTAPSWINGTGVKFSRLRGPAQIIQMEPWFSENMGNEPLYLGGHVYGNEIGGSYGRWTGSQLVPVFYGPQQDLNRGQWMQIEIYYRLNTISPSVLHDGSFEVKFDGVSKLAYSGTVQFRNTDTAYNMFYFPSNIGTPDANNINYIDDVEIWSGIPDEPSDTIPPSAPSGLAVL